MQLRLIKGESLPKPDTEALQELTELAEVAQEGRLEALLVVYVVDGVPEFSWTQGAEERLGDIMKGLEQARLEILGVV